MWKKELKTWQPVSCPQTTWVFACYISVQRRKELLKHHHYKEYFSLSQWYLSHMHKDIFEQATYKGMKIIWECEQIKDAKACDSSCFASSESFKIQTKSSTQSKSLTHAAFTLFELIFF